MEQNIRNNNFIRRFSREFRGIWYAVLIFMALFLALHCTANSAQAAKSKTYKNLSYTENFSYDAEQTMDLQVPTWRSTPAPVLVYIHGGSWVSGDKTSTEVRQILNSALKKGYAIASINYRLIDSECKFPAQIYDCKTAIRFLRAMAKKYDLDPDRIAVIGASAGAHLALLLGTTNGDEAYEDLSQGYADYSSDVQMVLSFYGVSDLAALRQNYGVTEDVFSAECKLFFGKKYTSALLSFASPIDQLDKGDVPVYITGGMNDAKVNTQLQSVNFAKKARSVLGSSKVVTYFPAKAAHADRDFWNSADMQKRVWNFLKKQWKFLAFEAKKAKITKAVVHSNRIRLTLKKVAGADGYQVRYAKSRTSANYVRVKTTKRSLTIQNLVPETTYYISVRAYNKLYGKTIYTAYSAKLKVRTETAVQLS